MIKDKWCPVYMLIIFMAACIMMGMGGCVTLTADEQEERRQVREYEAWVASEKVKACRAIGGTTVKAQHRDPVCLDRDEMRRLMESLGQ